MELAEYGTLKSLFTGNESHFDINKYRVKLCSDISRGMDYLHKHNPPIIHRDLKSSNILLCRSEDGTPIAKVKKENRVFHFELTFSLFAVTFFQISDFGLAVVGNEEMKDDNYNKTVYSYLRPPEALEGHAFSSRSDVYRFFFQIDRNSLFVF